MSIHNIEIKAHCNNPDAIRDILQKHGADFIGTDHQVDIYFQVPQGRLKLRRGTIEQKLIFYQRNNQKGPKSSDIHLVPATHPQKMQALLENALGTKVTVDKQREIYFIDNVKFHIDEVKELGSFMEIEAIDEDRTVGEEKLQQQCQKYMALFNIQEEDLVAESYSDLLLKR
ncbi:class IV adenylate cyclase [Aliifodinibius salicampi]|uniref:Class IV adenylate cyclase n=1 Tax=Fodinibius salicampi TaxID=1920655 RepID=A0ABT3PYR0_9BACT|nr:class IV adenylate cyclase [Fodinibius salicampi]MCW9713005.1 class IV adenylate cyclase [Fodinibius salicampi]